MKWLSHSSLNVDHKVELRFHKILKKYIYWNFYNKFRHSSLSTNVHFRETKNKVFNYQYL